MSDALPYPPVEGNEMGTSGLQSTSVGQLYFLFRDS